MIEAEPVTEHVFFNAARRTSMLLVEGESDRRFWEWRVGDSCNVRALSGKTRVLEELEKFRVERLSGSVGLIDADWHHLGWRCVTCSCPENLLMTDAHDLEATLLQSEVLDKLLFHYGKRELVERFVEQSKTTVRDALLQRAVQLGRLRWLSEVEGYELVFRKAKKHGFAYIPYGDFIDEETWQLDVRRMIQSAKNFSERPRLDVPAVVARLEEFDDADAWQVCNGHDLCGVLAVGLRRVLGNRKSGDQLSGAEIEDKLIFGYERPHLERTAMFAGMRAWEGRNAPYTLF